MKYKPRPQSNTYSKTKLIFGNPVASLKPNPRFIPIPAQNVQPADLSYDLSNLLGAPAINNINSQGQIVFHLVGDTGGVNGTEIEDEIANQMAGQIVANANNNPSFYFHLGDVIYYNGISTDYNPQFYEPYQYYPAPIFAIPGNHDGDTRVSGKDPKDTEPSLTGFFDNFCATSRTPSPDSPYRYTMNQPWPYWVLNAPFLTIIGLYTNVDGSLDDSKGNTQGQYNWFVQQLKNADPNKCLVLALHHPPFSLDSVHGGYPDILDAIDQAAAEANRYPDAVFSGHVHSYQRFTRTINNQSFLYVIAGAGGYATNEKSMHKLQTDPNNSGQIPLPFQTTRADVVLENYNTQQPGFLRLTADGSNLKGEYFVNSFDNVAASANPFDSFNLDWKNKIVSAS
jgi:hypothetical protein